MPRAAPPAQRAKPGIFDERGPYVFSRHQDQPSAMPPDIDYTHDQLSEYQPKDEDEAYETVRLSSVRRGAAHGQDKTVHVFEMYWADLVTVGAGLRLLGDIYQIILHLASVGQHAVDMALAANPKKCSWKLFGFIHDLATRFFSLPLPILNLLLLSSAVMALTGTLDGALAGTRFAVAVPYIAWVILGILLAVLFAIVLFWLDCIKNAWWRAGVWLCSMIVAVGAGCFFAKWQPIASEKMLALESLFLTIGLLIPVFRSYAGARPGAGLIAIIACMVTAADGVYEIGACSNEQMLLAGLHLSELLWLMLSASWTCLLLLSLSSLLAGWVVIFTALPGQRTCDRRVVWTARLTLALPTVLFFILTLTLWAGVLFAASELLPAKVLYQPSWVDQLLGKFHLLGWFELGGDNVKEYANNLWQACAGCVLGPIAALTVLAAIFGVWALLPGILAELNVPDDQRARRLKYAHWLDGGFALLRVAGGIIVVASLLIIPLAIPSGIWAMLHLDALGTFHDWLKNYGPPMFIIVGGLVAGAGGLRLLPGRLGNAVKNIAVPLRAALDVDAYLRVHPMQSNPKAKIFARYVSLLRYLAKWTDPNDPKKQYDKIVIVSHSQGTVITADLFRFLRHFPDKSLNRFFGHGVPSVPVHLFTMGCPLRQLYGRRLPHLYWWTDHNPAMRPSQQNPDPAELQVTTWSNAYRSGDYIGRNLWRRDDRDTTWLLPRRGVKLRHEFCIGPGAHVHYWDASDQQIAKEIDALIA
jgi:hypothetical protein